MKASPEIVVNALRTVIDPATGRDIVRNDLVRDLHIDDDIVRFSIVIAGAIPAYLENVDNVLEDHLTKVTGSKIEVKVNVETAMISLGEDILQGGRPSSNVEFGRTNILAIASGKGGVGKSTVAVNLAVALARQGFSVGLVDTDIYGPSIPTMFGITNEKPRVNEHRKILPLERYGVKLLSMGFLTDSSQAVIWRGPMVSNAVRQFLGDAAWGDLDYLLLDLPPGTGDIQLTIVQTISLTGAIIVSTPQKVALADARRGVAMFENVNVPVLGIIENMAYFSPPDLPEKKYYIFGKEGARKLSEELEVPFLGEVPIEEHVRESGDIGKPFMVEDLSSQSAQAFNKLASEAITQTALYKAGLSASGKIEITYRS